MRQDNIEIGNEYFLENIFRERRFATWHKCDDTAAPLSEVHLFHSAAGIWHPCAPVARLLALESTIFPGGRPRHYQPWLDSGERRGGVS